MFAGEPPSSSDPTKRPCRQISSVLETFRRLLLQIGGANIAARIALKAYLATLGAGKVGFTILGKQADGDSQYVGGLRGIVERNVMRYYLAIEAHLGALSVPPDARAETSMRDWFAATERYPLQLHELGRSDYFEMKRVEYRRQAPLISRAY